MADLPPTLSITVTPQGEVSTDFTRFVGQECLAAGKQLHALLAGYGIVTDLVTFTPKPELAMTRPSGEMAVQMEALQEGGRSDA